MGRSQSQNRKLISQIALTAITVTLILAGCGPGTPENIITHTPTASLTPTCAPVSLSTPVGWNNSSRLIVILYDPRSAGSASLNFENRETTQDVALFIRRIVPNLMKPGDQLAIFQLGYSLYEAAQVTRLYSYTTLPLLYNTPSPKATLTPFPTFTASTGFGPVQAANQEKVLATERAKIESEDASDYNCRIEYWNENIKETATIWNITATAEITNIHSTLESEFKRFMANSESMQIPFSTDELLHGGVYDGLGFATTIFRSDESGCKQYTECVLIIIDDLQTFGKNNPDKVTIDLNGISIYAIMPNCRDIDSPSCNETKSYWNNEFKRFGATAEPRYWNGDRAEINLLDAIGR